MVARDNAQVVNIAAQIGQVNNAVHRLRYARQTQNAAAILITHIRRERHHAVQRPARRRYHRRRRRDTRRNIRRNRHRARSVRQGDNAVVAQMTQARYVQRLLQAVILKMRRYRRAALNNGKAVYRPPRQCQTRGSRHRCDENNVGSVRQRRVAQIDDNLPVTAVFLQHLIGLGTRRQPVKSVMLRLKKCRKRRILNPPRLRHQHRRHQRQTVIARSLHPQSRPRHRDQNRNDINRQCRRFRCRIQLHGNGVARVHGQHRLRPRPQQRRGQIVARRDCHKQRALAAAEIINDKALAVGIG